MIPMNTHTLTYFAASSDYGCDTYGSGGYNENSCTSVGSPDTGVAPLYGNMYFVGGGVLVIIAAVLAVSMLVRKKRKS